MIRRAGILVAVLLTIGFGFFTLFVTLQRDAASLDSRTRNLWAIVFSLATYDEVHCRLPPAVLADNAGMPLSSWRFAIVPFSPSGPTGPEDTRALYPDLDHSWDHPVNREATSRPLFLYCFESGKTASAIDTNVLAITGPGTAFDPGTHYRMRDLPNDTILLIEASDTGFPWAAPGDLDVRNNDQSVTFGTTRTGFLVAFADRSVWHLKQDTPRALLRQFFNVEAARELDREKELGQYVIDRRSGS